LDETDQHLAAVDSTMSGLIARFGPVDLQVHAADGDRFGALILAIVSQQLSTRVARAIYMFNLHRPDIMASGDLGIRKAAQSQYQLDALPDIATVTRLAEPWRPYRTRACFYLWRSLETAPVPTSTST
jgi:3-methyladenine DNA glycosylase/8-oxoguanine DNA glycosylase